MARYTQSVLWPNLLLLLQSYRCRESYRPVVEEIDYSSLSVHTDIYKRLFRKNVRYARVMYLCNSEMRCDNAPNETEIVLNSTCLSKY